MVVRAHLKQGFPEIEKGSTCVLGISVGQIAHENGQLIETLKLLKESGITKFIFLVADSLQRYTLALTELTLEPDQFKNVADNLGKQWIARNTGNISSIIGNDYRIIYWDKILENENFQPYYSDIEQKLSDDEDFRSAVESTADRFIKRYQRQRSIKNPSNDELNRYKELSNKYVIEECTGLMLLGKGLLSDDTDLDDKDYATLDFFAYPGEIIKAFEKARELFLKQEDTLKYLTVKFKPGSKSVTAWQPDIPHNVPTMFQNGNSTNNQPGHRESVKTIIQAYVVGLVEAISAGGLSPEMQAKLLEVGTKAAFAQAMAPSLMEVSQDAPSVSKIEDESSEAASTPKR